MDSQLLGENTVNALQDLLKMPTEESDSDDDFKVCWENVRYLLPANYCAVVTLYSIKLTANQLSPLYRTNEKVN